MILLSTLLKQALFTILKYNTFNINKQFYITYLKDTIPLQNVLHPRHKPPPVRPEVDLLPTDFSFFPAQKSLIHGECYSPVKACSDGRVWYLDSQ